MTFAKAMTITLLSATLGACALSIEGGDRRYDHDARDGLSVKLPNGERAEFSCPKGMDSFIERSEDGEDLVYGCKSR